MLERLSQEESLQKAKEVDALFKNFVFPESEKRGGYPTGATATLGKPESYARGNYTQYDSLKGESSFNPEQLKYVVELNHETVKAMNASFALKVEQLIKEKKPTKIYPVLLQAFESVLKDLVSQKPHLAPVIKTIFATGTEGASGLAGVLWYISWTFNGGEQNNHFITKPSGQITYNPDVFLRKHIREMSTDEGIDALFQRTEYFVMCPYAAVAAALFRESKAVLSKLKAEDFSQLPAEDELPISKTITLSIRNFAKRLYNDTLKPPTSEVIKEMLKKWKVSIKEMFEH
jgi:hypothetical protein